MPQIAINYVVLNKDGETPLEKWVAVGAKVKFIKLVSTFDNQDIYDNVLYINLIFYNKDGCEVSLRFDKIHRPDILMPEKRFKIKKDRCKVDDSLMKIPAEIEIHLFFDKFILQT
jgi:hypothetical protein